MRKVEDEENEGQRKITVMKMKRETMKMIGMKMDEL